MLTAIYRRHRITVQPAKCEDGAERLYWVISNKTIGLCANGLKDPDTTEDECVQGLLAHIDLQLALDNPWVDDPWQKSQEFQAAA